MAVVSRRPPDPAREAPPSSGPWAVIGAGVHGLTAIKALHQLGVSAQAYEQASEVGGSWNFEGPTSRVHESTHTIFTKPFTQFPDFPMPASYPDYPSHRQVQEYIKRYATHFGLYDRIKFGCEVVAVEPAGHEVDVTVCDLLTDERSTRRFAGVVIATGHSRHPRLPYYPGLPLFKGQRIHSADYRSAEQLRGKRVLVVGAGNTGCDIAVDAAVAGSIAYHSARRGYWFRPKYAFGRPVDQLTDLLLALRVPLEIRRLALKATIRVVVGDVTALSLARPDHPFSETHPVVNQLVAYFVGHGRLVPKPEIVRFGEDSVVFVDGSSAEIDMVVFATGYQATLGFIAPELLHPIEGRPELGRHLFSPAHPAIAVAGLIRTDAGHGTLAHWQAMLIAHYARTRRERPADAAEYAERVAGQCSRGGADTGSARRPYEVAHQDYLKALQTDIRLLEGAS